jgi:hypothetical protein
MKWQALDQKTRLYFISGAILLVGLLSALLIFVIVSDDYGRNLGYKAGYGSVNFGPPQQTKRFLHDLQLYGGKANVFFYGVMSWFKDLWHGKNLAYTIAGLSIFISAAILFVGVYLPRFLAPEGNQKDQPDGFWDETK